MNYQEKQAREISWWEQKPKQNLISKLLRKPVFYSQDRSLITYDYIKNRMASSLEKVDKLLVAPCGSGADYTYFKDQSKDIYGIDLSEIAVRVCPPGMKVKVGDILQSGYMDNEFDAVASPLFFHHFRKYGFDNFLKEFYRILKPGGKIVILEPNIFYPLNLITRPIKFIFNNPFGEVEDEGPLNPTDMINALKRTGYRNIEVRGASFSHPLFYKPIARSVIAMTVPFLNSPLKYLAWMLMYKAER